MIEASASRPISAALQRHRRLREAGLCVRCGDKPARPGYSTCEGCKGHRAPKRPRAEHYKCGACDERGHNRRKCPKLSNSLPAIAASADVHTEEG